MDWDKALEQTNKRAEDYEDINLEVKQVIGLNYSANNDIWGKDTVTLTIGDEDKVLTFTSWSYSQLCTKLNIPCGYMKRCSANLRDENMLEWIRAYTKSLLLRTSKSKSEIRAILSNKYLVLNDNQLLEMLQKKLSSKTSFDTMKIDDGMSQFFLSDTDILEVDDLDQQFRVGTVIRNSEIGKLAFQGSICLTRLDSRGHTISYQTVQQKLSTSRKHIGSAHSDSFRFLNDVEGLVGLLPEFRENARISLERAATQKPIRSDLDKIKAKVEDIFGMAWANEKWPEIEINKNLTWFNLADLISIKATEENLPEMTRVRGARLSGALLGI